MASSFFLHLFVLLLLFVLFSSQVTGEEVKPRMHLKSKLVSENMRRKLGSFQICALCTCCGGPKGLCLPSPCCYSINCNIPNRPFGFCSFTPKACNCFGCHL